MDIEKNDSNLTTVIDRDISGETVEKISKKRAYLSPTLTKIGEINHSTKGKNTASGDPGNWFES
ncbi:MAG: hypothetical protein DRG30_03570 [Epsilonproteobacteria bacterium]|nr:MAG: hypothetical protein DRG30_03570 [Campylobacterota bacterium]